MTSACTIGKVSAPTREYDTVGEDADAIERDPASGFERAMHGIGLERLHADDPDRWLQRLDVTRDARDQASAADRNEDRAVVIAAMPENLDADGALTRNHQLIVERMNRDACAFRGDPGGMIGRVGVAVADELDAGTQLAHRVNLDCRRRARHHDQGVHAQVTRGVLLERDCRRLPRLHPLAFIGREVRHSPYAPRSL